MSHIRLTEQLDQKSRNLEKNGSFTVKLYYRQLSNGVDRNLSDFPFKQIWKIKTPSRMAFFTWEACKGSILTTDMLMTRGRGMVNRCFMCKMSAETCNHLLLWCPMVYSLWNMIYELLGINWVMAGSVRDEIYHLTYPLSLYRSFG